MTTAQAFRVKGTTSDVTECGLCGRSELKGTIALEVLDVEGNGTGEVVYYGSDCGAKAAGWTQSELKARVRKADDEARRAAQAARYAEGKSEDAKFFAWVFETYGIAITSTSQLWDHEKTLGMSPFHVRKAYRASA